MVVETALEKGQKYDLRFDLTVGAVVTAVRSDADPLAQDILKHLKGKRPHLFAIPVVSGIELRSLKTGPIEFTLDPQRLSGSAPRKDGESDLDYLQRITAATITMPVLAEEPGCGFVGLSLWTASDDNTRPSAPFEFILRRVQVGTGGGDCGATKLLQSGMSSAFINRAGIAVDAALHIFQLPTGTPRGTPQEYSQAIYVDGSGKPLTWQLSSDLASYVADPKTYFSRELHWALQLHDYRPLRRALTNIIFPVDNEAAKQALVSIRAVAARGNTKPVTVYASLVNTEGWPQVFPIGLVNGDNEEALGRRITFIEPLPMEHATDSRCVSQWTFVLPPELLSDNGFTCTVADTDAKDGLMTVWDGLYGYLTGAGTAADPEGLLLLAHQGNGVLSFDPSGDPGIKTFEVKHGYTAGSMGLLLACEGSSSGAALADLSWMMKFNELNMDVILVSPFSLPIDVGGCFARQLRMALENAKKNSTRVTIAEIYRSVIAEMFKGVSEEDEREALNATYQFVLAGNAQLPVCGSAR